jgi:hypothetical protein
LNAGKNRSYIRRDGVLYVRKNKDRLKRTLVKSDKNKTKEFRLSLAWEKMVEPSINIFI